MPQKIYVLGTNGSRQRYHISKYARKEIAYYIQKFLVKGKNISTVYHLLDSRGMILS